MTGRALTADPLRVEEAWPLRRSDPARARTMAEPDRDDPQVALLTRTVLHFPTPFDGQRGRLFQPVLDTAEGLRTLNEPERSAGAAG